MMNTYNVIDSMGKGHKIKADDFSTDEGLIAFYKYRPNNKTVRVAYFSNPVSVKQLEMDNE